MSSTDRQNRLIAAEDWKKIYKSFKNAEFQSYDFDNLRRTMISYIRENYPEDFNDYVESSEYLALIDLIAFLGQNLAFRFDLNARDNFLELAERRDSVLRWARLLSYKTKRNQAANGLLKFTSVSTTENIIDSNGRNLANQTIVWNDPTNPNWNEQFIKIINASVPKIAQFGSPEDSSTINGIKCEQYRFNGVNTEVPLYSFTKPIGGRNTTFEIISTVFKDAQSIYEEAPSAGNNMAFVYRNDGRGASSSNSGFFLMFKQGTLQNGTFNVARPSPNEKVDLDAVNVNDADVWLYSADAYGTELDLWTKVDSTHGTNVIYNSLSKNTRKVYTVLSRTSDRISLMFADGVFGDLPSGPMKVYYRTSNGLSYVINPADITSVTINVPYMSHVGKTETLRLTLSLKSAVVNASETESSDSVKLNAPATYYTQGRMITGEDYNILPQSVDQEIIKSHAVNRISSGISRYYDLSDASGTYSNTTLIGNDGILYKEYFSSVMSFRETTRSGISNVVANQIQPLLRKPVVKDFYFDFYKEYVKQHQEEFEYTAKFVTVSGSTNMYTGYFRDNTGIPKLGTFATDAKYKDFTTNALIRFKNSAGDYKWVKIVKVINNGTANGTGILTNHQGPVTLNDYVDETYTVDYVIPRLSGAFTTPLQSRMVDLIFAKRNFGVRYNIQSSQWEIVNSVDINTVKPFDPEPDYTGTNQDSSWVFLFETNGDQYRVTYRAMRYVFESDKEIRFYFDSGRKVYDTVTGKTIKDAITVLGINKAPNADTAIGTDIIWDVVDDYKGNDGFVDSHKLVVTFNDSDQDGVSDDPDIFDNVVGESSIILWKKTLNSDGSVYYAYFDNADSAVKFYQDKAAALQEYHDEGDYVFLHDAQEVFQYFLGDFVATVDFIAYEGRSKLTFKYQHAASSTARIDPSSTNIIDVFLLTKAYDVAYRQWITGVTATKPSPLSSDEMFVNFGEKINKLKSISDEVVYHPVKYKALFGSKAGESLQAVFKVTKNSSMNVSDNDVKVGVISAINQFFSVENWNFGDTFYFSELNAYIVKQLSPQVVNVIITPKQPTLAFGSLFEIKSRPDEIFISAATVEDVEIISEVTAAKLNVMGTVLNSTVNKGY